MKAFLFDLDGVIIDSMPMHMKAWESYLERHGISIENLWQQMIGKHNDELVHQFWGPSPDIDHGAEKEALFREMIDPVFDQYLVPGVVEFIRANPLPKAVGSNAEKLNIDYTLKRSGLVENFRLVVSGDEVERPKPNPDVYLRAAELLKVEPKDCIVFEDSPTGVAAARAAGMRVVGVDTGKVNLDQVDVRVDHFLDPRLAAWLSQQE